MSRNERSAATVAPVVLLVEDEDGLRTVLKRFLEREGLIVLPAQSALHAMQVLEEHGDTVDLVVADYHMTGPTGLRLLETVRDEWPHAGRMLLTGDSSLKYRSFEAVDRVLDKGDTAEGLVDSIVQAARQRNGERRRSPQRR